MPPYRMSSPEKVWWFMETVVEEDLTLQERPTRMPFDRSTTASHVGDEESQDDPDNLIRDGPGVGTIAPPPSRAPSPSPAPSRSRAPPSLDSQSPLDTIAANLAETAEIMRVRREFITILDIYSTRITRHVATKANSYANLELIGKEAMIAELEKLLIAEKLVNKLSCMQDKMKVQECKEKRQPMMGPTVKIPTVKLPALKVPTAEALRVKVPTVKAPTVEVPTVKAPTVEVPAVKAPALLGLPKMAPPLKGPPKMAPFKRTRVLMGLPKMGPAKLSQLIMDPPEIDLTEMETAQF